jgi:hypothetical protein
LIDDRFEEEVLEPPLREDRGDATEDDAELPRHPDVHEPATAEQGQPDVGDGATAGDPEPDEVRDELIAQAMDYSRCVEAVAALAYSTTMS